MLQIRKAMEQDLGAILALVKELAEYEKAPNEVSNTVEQMRHDGFSDNKIYDAFVAILNGEIIGTAITYYRFSTWKGKCLYLEDLIVTKKHRGIGAGKKLFDHCVAFGKANDCVRMNWQVLDWNTPAIDFYKNYNANLDSEWINGSLELSPSQK